MIEFNGKKGTLYRFILKFINLTDKTGISIGKGSKIVNGTTIGDGSRINGEIIIKGRGSCTIGKYVAFGENIRIITSNHKTDEVILQYALFNQLGFKSLVDPKINVFIGHNVWIGDQAIILPGVSIGNGAIVGAGSVVTKDVPAYAVVAGAPAKFIRSTFSPQKIEEIEKLQWWDWTLEEMKKNKELLHKN